MLIFLNSNVIDKYCNSFGKTIQNLMNKYFYCEIKMLQNHFEMLQLDKTKERNRVNNSLISTILASEKRGNII